MRKPEPLTKEKEKTVSEVEFYNNKGLIDIKNKNKENVKEVFTVFEKLDVKSAVDWLLKEIEKETNKYLDTYSHPDDEALRRILEAFFISITEKIKKSFSGVIEE